MNERIHGWYRYLNQPQWHWLYLVLLVLVTTLIFYAPYWFSDSMELVKRHWDGPNYAYVAYTLYDIPPDHPLKPYGTTQAYFACHLPIYPLAIKLFSFLGYTNAMLLVSMLFTMLATVTFYQLVKETQVVKSPLWAAVCSLFIPARYIISQHIGATEPAFLFLTFASMLAWHRGHYWWACLLGGLSGITRIVGILIGFAYLLMLLREKRLWKYLPALVLIPAPLLLTFTFYHFQYGDFFAYFSWNAKLLAEKPLSLYQYFTENNQRHSAELHLAMYSIALIGISLLWSKNKVFFWYCLTHFIFALFIVHDDVSRYLIPLAPFALVVAYDDILQRKAVRFALIPYVVLAYIYTWDMIPHNMVVDWVYADLLKVIGD